MSETKTMTNTLRPLIFTLQAAALLSGSATDLTTQQLNPPATREHYRASNFPNLTDKDQPPPENATSQRSLDSRVIAQAKEIFSAGKYDEFEDGFESNFSRALQQFLKRGGTAAVNAVQNLILSSEVNSEVASEALRWIGRIEQPHTHSERMWLLLHCLGSTSPRIRDGALLGLSSFNDPKCLPFVQGAIKEDVEPELLIDIQQLEQQLEETARWRSSFAK